MPIAYDIDAERGLVRFDASGTPTHGEWVAAVGEAFADRRYAPGFNFLYDRSRVGLIPDAVSLRRLAAVCAPLLEQVRGARFAVVVSQPVIYGMMRVASVFAESRGLTLDVFWTEAEALDWLGRAVPRVASDIGPRESDRPAN